VLFSSLWNGLIFLIVKFFNDFVKKPDFLHHNLIFCFQLRQISKEAPGAKKDGANSGDNKKCTDAKYR
jgi:hypothetical protein